MGDAMGEIPAGEKGQRGTGRSEPLKQSGQKVQVL